MTEQIPISVLIQTKNEEAVIAECIAEVSDFAEVVVVDSMSTDATVHIAQQQGVRVVDFEWSGGYPKKKQWQIDNVSTSHEWILFLDADESPTRELINELRTLFTSGDVSPEIGAFDVQLTYHFAGRELLHGHRVVKRVLLRRGAVAFPVVQDLGDDPAFGMGELEGHYQPIVDGTTNMLQSKLRHHDVDPVRTWFDRHNRYSSWEAALRVDALLRSDVRQAKSRQGQLFDRVPLKPLAFFIYSWIVRGGFRDGRAGFDYAVALSMYYWQIGVKARELRRIASR